MTRKKRKAVSFDAMVKYFMLNYDIPTKADVDKLHRRLDRLELLIKKQTTRATARRTAKQAPSPVEKKGRSPLTASDTVYNIMKRTKKGLKFGDIKAKTGYEDKKLRNILFRLHSLKRIERVSRGVYTVAK
jgi:hypothetical protein